MLEAEYSEIPDAVEYNSTSLKADGSGRAYVTVSAIKFGCTVNTVAHEGLVICLTIGVENWVCTVKLIVAAPVVWIVAPYILI